METDVTVDSAGRIVLTSAMRRLLDLHPDSKLRLTVVAHRIEMTPPPNYPPALQLSPNRRWVLEPVGKPFDAAAVTRVPSGLPERNWARRAKRRTHLLRGSGHSRRESRRSTGRAAAPRL